MVRLHTTGTENKSRLLCLLANATNRLRHILTVEMTLPTGAGKLRFYCTNAKTLRRACTFYIKEPGTVAWLGRTLRPGDVFLDIGANVGIYTLFAAQRVGTAGHVFAIEPHLPNAVRLMENLQINGFGDRVTVLATALAETSRTAQFEYWDWYTGSSRSQLGGMTNTAEDAAAPSTGIRELKLAQSLDNLIENGALTAPQVVKIDVDGGELAILRGMDRLLRSPLSPRSVQVECTPDNDAQVEAEFVAHGYRLVQRHTSRAGKKKLGGHRSTADGEEGMRSILHNAVFERGSD